ncbi:MAG: OmpA family protein [Gammaproteobacteria bacterium]
MKRFTALCALGAVAVTSVPAFAADADVGGMYVTPMIGVLRADKDRPTDGRDYAIGSLALGKHLSEAWSAEVLLNGTKLQGDPAFAPDVTLWGGSLDLLRVFNRAGRFSPYIGVGAGAVEYDITPGAAGADAMWQASIGAFWTLWEGANGNSFALRPDFKARWDDAHTAGRLTDYIGQLGFQYTWGGTKRVASIAPPPPVAVAPAPPPPPVVPAPPGDEDHDGVTDDRDRCPGTPPGVAVDANGCPQKGSITLEGVTFEYNSANLQAGSLNILDDVADGLKKHPRLKVELQGHTDSRGPDAYNLTLSQKRADSVRAYLLKDGVPTTQITAKGYGEGQPIADNNTDAGRAQNRRVVMFVIDNPGDVEIKGAGEAK